MKYGDKTKYKDKNGHYIYIGDGVVVQEYPDEYVGGSLDYEGVIEWNNESKTVVATYYDIGEEESTPLKCFPIKGRTLLTEQQRKSFWRLMLLGAEPAERLYK